MKGLLIKDFLQLKKEFNIFYLFLMFLPTISGLANTELFLPILTILIGLYWGTFVLTGLGKDDAYSWRQTTLSFPLSLRKLVIEKYIFALCLVICSVVTVFFIGICTSSFLQVSIRYVSFYSVISGMLGFFFSVLVIPISYRFGVNSCRYFIFSFAGFPGIMAMLANYFEIDYLIYLNGLNLTRLQIASFIVGLLICCLIISVHCAMKSYRKP